MTSSFGIKAHAKGRRGFSLPEFAIVLGVIGLVLGTLWGIVAIVRENIKREEMTEQVAMMVKNIREFYLGRPVFETPAGSGSFLDMTHYLLSQNVLLPEQIRDRTAVPLRADHPWGPAGASGSALSDGGLAVDNTNNGASAISDKFRIQLRGLSFPACVAMVAKLSGGTALPGLTSVKVNGSGIRTPPVTPEQAAEDCIEDPGGDENKMDFVYRLRVQR